MRNWVTVWLIATAGCASDDPAGSSCEEDADCGASSFCQASECVAASTLACVDGDSSRVARISVSPLEVDFGDVAATPVPRLVELASSGPCTLRIGSFVLEARAESRFRCPTCEAAPLPLSLPPGRKLLVELVATPGESGTFVDTWVIRSSDPASEYVSIPLRMRSLGEPLLVADPESVDFGFVPGGTESSKVVTLLNAGGTSLEVTTLRLEGVDSTDFDLAPVALPRAIDPARVVADSKLEVEIRYSPLVTGAHASELRVEAKDLPPIRVPLASRSEPPEIELTTGPIDFGLLRVGREARRSVTVQNTGHSLLVVRGSLSASGSNDFFVSPMASTIAVGGFVELAFRYAPTIAGAASNRLTLSTNDPDEPTFTFDLSGRGEAPPPGDEVIVIELDFKSDSSSILDSDVRDVDLILESPLGKVCGETQRDPDWGAEGRPRWSGGSGGSERIVLAGATQDGEYVIHTQYLEDCASLPTQLAARLLGIGTQELTDYFSDGEVTLDGPRVAGMVESLCFQHSAADATITVGINGVRGTPMAMALMVKGSEDGVRLIRQDGRFRVAR
ncbi:MAG: choice-of-anchor D domain-containing protein [Deltaproteobacteria bacterium]|nr:choice-of-anchor D domain-containing protein [Deltaproteobacteria bacterium]